jgi:hypothetical protein
MTESKVYPALNRDVFEGIADMSEHHAQDKGLSRETLAGSFFQNYSYRRLSLIVPIVHMMGKGVGVTSSIANSSGYFFFVWTLISRSA